tara:strand:+ start:490 stop:678 length:189 start_codon:yes stop_codon:yes gene_type:complete
LIRVCDRIAEKSNWRKNFKEKWDVINPQLVRTIIGAVSTLMGVGLYINDGSITSAAFIPFNK